MSADIVDTSTQTYLSGGGGILDTMLPGSIDDVRIYNYARTPAQIAWEYNHGGPVGLWKLDECTGSTAYDLSGNANNGSITLGAGSQTTPGNCATSDSAAAWYNGRNGKFNSSINLDGTDDYINITDNPIFDLYAANSYTWSAWLKPNSFREVSSLWTQQETTSPEAGFYIYTHTTTNSVTGPVTAGISLVWCSNDGGTCNETVQLHSKDNVLSPGRFSHVVVTYQGNLAQSSRFTIYVDGIDVTDRSDIFSSGTLGDIFPASGNINIGRDGG
jgi:hypothetical protein